VLGLVLDPLYLDCDLVADERDTDGVRAEATVSLLSDARADAEALRQGQVNRGYWADAFETDPTQVGSLLWLSEPLIADDAHLSEATRLAELALAPMIAERRVSEVAITTTRAEQQLVMTARLTLPDGSMLTLDPFRVN
jgi:phage gp46-like protein